MNCDTGDRYADVSPQCGIAAFKLPPWPGPDPRNSTGHHSDQTTNLFGPIPDHLLSRYLCYDPAPAHTAGAASTSPEVHSSSSIRCSLPPPLNYKDSAAIRLSSEPLLVDSPSQCPNFTEPLTGHPSPEPLLHDSPLPPPDFTAPVTIASSTELLLHNSHRSSEILLHESRLSYNESNLDSPASEPYRMDSLVKFVHEREILPPCVVNYQDSPYLTPEGERCSHSASVGVGDSDNEKIPNLLRSEIKEMVLCDPNDVLTECDIEHLVSGMSAFKHFAFAGGNGKRLLSQIKKLALSRKNVSLDDKELKKMVSFMTSFRDFAFSSEGRKNSWYESGLKEPSRKEQRKRGAKSKGVAFSLRFTRSKSVHDSRFRLRSSRKGRNLRRK